MIEGKAIDIEELDYKIAFPRMAYYLKSRNIVAIFKEKYALFAAVGGNEVTPRSTWASYFCGHNWSINSLCPLSSNILASGSDDKTIKIWDIVDRSIMSTLSKHTDTVRAICYVKEGIFVSGSSDKSLIIWNKSPGLSTYSHGQVLRGHASYIMGIIRISDREIVSGEYYGGLRLWDIDQGDCMRSIPNVGGYSFYGMKQHVTGELAIGYRNKVIVWGVANWAQPVRQINGSGGTSIEFLSQDILLRGGRKGQLEFIYYAQTDAEIPSIHLHSGSIFEMLRIAKDIVITSGDNTLKVINPISKECYMIFKQGRRGYCSIASIYQSTYSLNKHIITTFTQIKHSLISQSVNVGSQQQQQKALRHIYIYIYGTLQQIFGSLNMRKKLMSEVFKRIIFHYM